MEDHDGILPLDGGTELGRDIREVLGLDDTIFDLAITTNRPDAMGIVGIARELAAHFGLQFTVPEPPGAAKVADRIDDVSAVVEAPHPLPAPGAARTARTRWVRRPNGCSGG